MRQESKNLAIKTTSINLNKYNKEIDNGMPLLDQTSVSVSYHQNPNKYRVLSNTNKAKESGVGLFNKKTNFIVTQNNSILIYKDNGEVTSLDIEEDKDGYLMYLYPFVLAEYHKLTNDTLTIQGKFKKIINLNYDLGHKIALYLKQGLGEFTKLEKDFMQAFVKTNNYGYALNEQLILNSNKIFLTGLIDGLFDHNNLFDNINIYSISLILNYLGAWFSINNLNNSKQIRIKLPQQLNEYSTMKSSYFKSKEKFIKSDKGFDINLIPLETLIFEKLKEDDININDTIYDLTMENESATNHTNMFTPFLKNSDGDILFCTGVWSKQGLEDAKKFSPELKDYYRDLGNGQIRNYIQHDAVLGLYNTTSHLK